MTYCLAINVHEGLIFCSDSRTNAGVDQVSTYSKMFTYSVPGERQVVICSAGNLATTQAVIKTVERHIEDAAEENLLTLPRMERIADYVGEISVARQAEHSGSGGIFEASFLVGGQVAGGKPEIYLVYPQGNHITATQDTPYLQIGEVKYGKPILDRSISCETPLETATVCALLSMDSTVRSNVTVGPPIELLALQRDSLMEGRRFRYDADNADIRKLHNLWEEKLQEAVASVPFRGWAFDWSGVVQAPPADAQVRTGTPPGPPPVDLNISNAQVMNPPPPPPGESPFNGPQGGGNPGNGNQGNGNQGGGVQGGGSIPPGPPVNGPVGNVGGPAQVGAPEQGQGQGQNQNPLPNQNQVQNPGNGQQDQTVINPIRNPL
ncbi:MAG: hypothetical protein ACPGU7_13540 [Gammaproteobacteria bacterium]